MTWSSSDESIATVNQTGLVTAHKSGNATITLATNVGSVTALVAVEHTWGEYHLVWSDEFDGSGMSKAWETGFLYPQGLKSNHSHTSECQAYMQGQNTSVSGSKLRISTKKEKVSAAAWHPTKGMIMHPFAFTSDIWHTVEAMTPKTGVLQAKVRCSGKAKHLLCLTTMNASKVVSIMGTQPTTGEMIYTLVWNEKELVNYLNNVEVSRGKNPLAGEALHLLVRSYLPDAQKAGTAQLDIDWIRIYTNA
jgi:hypothetical protein